MINPSVKKVIAQLKKADLSTEDRMAIMNAILLKLNALPIGDMVQFTSDGISINGRLLDVEQAMAFRESAVALKDNYARRVIAEQVRYKAINLGINVALSVDTLMFSKAALWCLNEQDILAEKLSKEV